MRGLYLSGTLQGTGICTGIVRSVLIIWGFLIGKWSLLDSEEIFLKRLRELVLTIFKGNN